MQQVMPIDESPHLEEHCVTFRANDGHMDRHVCHYPTAQTEERMRRWQIPLMEDRKFVCRRFDSSQCINQVKAVFPHTCGFVDNGGCVY